MGEPERESLIVLSSGADPLEAVSHAGGRLTQRLGDRVALAVVSEGARDALAARGDVMHVYDEEVPDAVRDGLDEPERLFVDAWTERRRTKHRTGDGLSWDAPGFRAP